MLELLQNNPQEEETTGDEDLPLYLNFQELDAIAGDWVQTALDQIDARIPRKAPFVSPSFASPTVGAALARGSSFRGKDIRSLAASIADTTTTKTPSSSSDRNEDKECGEDATFITPGGKGSAVLSGKALSLLSNNIEEVPSSAASAAATPKAKLNKGKMTKKKATKKSARSAGKFTMVSSSSDPSFVTPTPRAKPLRAESSGDRVSGSNTPVVRSTKKSFSGKKSGGGSSSKNQQPMSFAEVIHAMVSDASISAPDVIEWLPSGEAFFVKTRDVSFIL